MLGAVYETKCGRRVMCIKKEPTTTRLEIREAECGIFLPGDDEGRHERCVVEVPGEYHFVNLKSFDTYVYTSIEDLTLVTNVKQPTLEDVLEQLRKNEEEVRKNDIIRSRKFDLEQLESLLKREETNMIVAMREVGRTREKCHHLWTEIAVLEGKVITEDKLPEKMEMTLKNVTFIYKLNTGTVVFDQNSDQPV